jgi:hypothetical protein
MIGNTFSHLASSLSARFLATMMNILCKFQIVMLWIALTELITVSKYTGEL